MRSGVFVALLVAGAGLGACGNGKEHAHPDGGFMIPDTPVLPWWAPDPGQAANWDIQLGTPFDVNADRAMYLLDLFASVPAATAVAYPSGEVVIPAGAHASAIASLHARGTKVVCRVGVGAIRLSDPDAAQFPGYNGGTVPDDPDPPAAGSVIGWSTGEPMERYLDPAQMETWRPIIAARFQLAKTIGCDGVEPYREDLFSGTTGFTDPSDSDKHDLQVALYTEAAAAIHALEMSAGMRAFNAALIDAMQVANHDWFLIERCGELQDCDTPRDFINARKAVFAIDYTTDIDGNALDPAVMCARQQTAMIQDGLVKDVALSSAARTQCGS